MINTALNFTGSKFKLLPQILPELDYTKKHFVDLFTGSFVVAANVLPHYETVLANDIIGDLVEIHEFLCFQPDDFIKEVKALCANNPEEYAALRSSYNRDKTAAKLYALMLCCTNNMMRFNQKFEFNQTYGKRTFNDSTAKKLVAFIEYVTPYRDKVTFQKGHFKNVKANGREKQMWYIDPPYGFTIGQFNNMSKKQISEAGYNAFWSRESEVKLFDTIRQLDKFGHSFMVSGLLEHKGQTSWLMSKLIADGFRHIVLDCNYDKVSRVEVSDSVEVIVMNYEEQI